ncbi:MAG: hypothetical protein MRY49_03140 [Candidatus Pacebacteria bacterium]|nr:hypothetical protein [Candidatus Paceibacterota bacterium]
MNKKRTVEELLELAGKSVVLSDAEKASVRYKLVKISKPKKSKLFFTKFVFAPLLILVILTSTVAASSADSLPGDRLYAVKTEVVEPLAGLIKINKERRVEYKEALASKRLEEMVLLSSEGKLDDIKKEKLLSLLSRHQQDVEQGLKGLGPEFASKVESNIESVLRAHGRIFVDLEEEDLKESIENSTVLASKRRVEAEGRVTADGKIAEDLKEKVSNEITDAEEILKDSSEILLAKEVLEEAESHIDAGSYNKAILLLNRSSRFTKEAIVVAQAEEKFAIKRKEIDSRRVEQFLDAVKVPEKVEVAITSAVMVNEEQEEVNLYSYFEDLVTERIGESNNPEDYLDIIPGLVPEDFEGVDLRGDILEVISESDDSKEGYVRLLINIATRLKVELSSKESVDYIWTQIAEM